MTHRLPALGVVAAAAVGIGLAIHAEAQSNAPPLPPSLAVRSLVALNDQPWRTLRGNFWNYLRRSSSRDADIVVDATAPYSPPEVLRIHFTPGLEHDRDPTVHWVGLPHVSEVYASWWIKLSPNWTPNPAGGGKMTFLWPPQGNGVLYSNIGGSALPHRINVVTTWPAYGYRFWEPNVATTPVSYDRWYRIEWYVRWSGPESPDGVIRWWVNGELNGDYPSVQFPACCLLQFEFAPTMQLPPPADQYMYVDHTWIGHPAQP